MRHSAKLLCLSAVCLLLMQATPAKAEVVFYATASRNHQKNWNNPERTTVAIKHGEEHKASISIQGSTTEPTVRIISGGTPDILYNVVRGEDSDDWFAVFQTKEGVIFDNDHILAVEINADNGARFPVNIKFKADPPPPAPAGNGGGVLNSQAWRGKLTLHSGYDVSSNPGGKAGHGFYLTFGGSLHTWKGKIPISIVLEGNVNYNNYRLEYNTLGITEWAHVNSTEFQPRVGVRISIPFNKKGFGLHITPFAGAVFRVVKHDNDATGLSDDLRMHLIHGRLELNGGLVLGVRFALYFNHWIGISAEVVWAGTWDTLKEAGDPVVKGFDSRVQGNLGVAGRF